MSEKPLPTSANFPSLILSLLMSVLDEGEITLKFHSKSQCWTTRKQIYGLRKALVREDHPRKHELEGISVSHDTATDTLTIRTLEHSSTGLAVVAQALKERAHKIADNPPPVVSSSSSTSSGSEPNTVPSAPGMTQLESLLAGNILQNGEENAND